MGARERARAKSKNKGSEKGSPWSQKKSNTSLQVHNLDPSMRHRALLQGWQDFSESSSPSSRNGFSMAQEARNTDRHTMGWGTTKLRDNAISFVSAGLLSREDPETTKSHKEDAVVPDKSLDDFSQTTESEGKTNAALPIREKFPTSEVEVLDEPNTDPSVGTDDIIAAQRGVYRQRKSSTSSSEADEVIFAGRHNPPRQAAKFSKPKVPDLAQDSNTQATEPRHVKMAQPPTVAQLSHSISSSDAIPSPSAGRSNKKPNNPRVSRRQQAIMDEEESLMQDYIANMVMDDEDEEPGPQAEPSTSFSKPSRRNEHYRFFNGADTTHENVQLESKRPKLPEPWFADQAADWSSADLDDFDDISTTDDEITEIGQVLRHRDRPSGPQYLVTAVDQGASDAKWMPHSKLISETAKEEIRIYQEIQLIQLDEGSEVEDSSSDDEEALEDLIGDIESEDDENARIMEHTSRMSDEQIAKMLAKQEELGLGSDELMLFNGHLDDDDDEEDMPGDEFQRGDGFVSFSMKAHTSNRSRSKRNRRQRDSFPSAAAFADALDEDPYGAFDVMDFDRPSLRPKRKGRKSDFPFDLELDDEELAEQLHDTWTKDREKKTARKKAKEEARQTTLFNDSERSEPAVIRAEIRRFLVQESDTLRLAPMDPGTRASVHRLAKSLKLNSRSEGKDARGVGRYPVLTKTVYTPSYTLDNIWEVDALLNQRKFFPKFGGGSYKSAKAPRMTTAVRRGGGGVMSGATYMNGEIVGASAPEIGAENKGRALLEKMGWTPGMGIGAIGNKGSIEVIKHVVKTTKAGLG